MNDMSENLTADQLEAEADRERERLNATVDELLLNLRPKSLASEWAQSAGLNDFTASDTIEFAYRRHPVALTLCGLALGAIVVAATRRASSMNMRTDSSSPVNLGRMRLMTRSLVKPSAPSVLARHTSAMPPTPMRSSRLYLP